LIGLNSTGPARACGSSFSSMNEPSVTVNGIHLRTNLPASIFVRQSASSKIQPVYKGSVNRLMKTALAFATDNSEAKECSRQVVCPIITFSGIASLASQMQPAASPDQICADRDRTVRYKHQADQRWRNDPANVHVHHASPFQ